MRFLHDVGNGTAALGAAQRGDDAEGALVVAALADLHVRGPPRHRVAAGRAGVGDVVRIGNDGAVALAPDDLRDARVGRGADEIVDLRHLLLQHVRVPLGQTAGDHQRLAPARLLVPGVIENGVDRFLLRIADEGAGIDQHHLRLARFLDQLVALLEQRSEHDFAVHPVLRAAEREQVQRGTSGEGRFLHERVPSGRGCFYNRSEAAVQSRARSAPAQSTQSSREDIRCGPRRDRAVSRGSSRTGCPPPARPACRGRAG